MSINVNCLSLWRKCNYKAERLKWAMLKYRLDSVGIQEVCVNWKSYKTPITLESLLRNGSDPIRLRKSFNTWETENIGYSQRGGTATVLQGALSKYVKDSNVNHTGLGRWSWVKLEGEPGHVTRSSIMVCARTSRRCFATTCARS